MQRFLENSHFGISKKILLTFAKIRNDYCKSNICGRVDLLLVFKSTACKFSQNDFKGTLQKGCHESQVFVNKFFHTCDNEKKASGLQLY